MQKYPKIGSTYTLLEIYNDLHLRDSPFLMIDIAGHRSVIQTSHIYEEELLTIKDFAQTKWTYLYETDEWIPLFKYADENVEFIDVFVDFEPLLDFNGNVVYGKYWVTPKGFSRKQSD